MRLQPEVDAADVAVLGASESPFVALVRASGPVAACRFCGGEVALRAGFADARDVQHSTECPIGPELARAGKPIVVRYAGFNLGGAS